VNDPPNGALGVRVGCGVFVGGTSENEVFVGNGVMVGRGVSVGVSSRVGLGVHVDCNWMGVTVNVGSAFENGPCPGGRGFKEEAGLIKINAK
jgi:UDP-3-O-[3-hydroxymyristoyl] glucosamine N-acyltransferase